MLRCDEKIFFNSIEHVTDKSSEMNEELKILDSIDANAFFCYKNGTVLIQRATNLIEKLHTIFFSCIQHDK